MNDILKELEKDNLGKVEYDVSMDKHTTYRVGGVASAIFYPKNVDGLIRFIRKAKQNNIKYKILGYGSNLLFSGKRYEGVLIKLDEFNDIEFFSSSKVRVGAGYSLVKLSSQAAKRGLAGLEFAAGIPGTVGGAVFMNAGAYKSCMNDVIIDVLVLRDGKFVWLNKDECQFAYRKSATAVDKLL